MLDAFLKEYQEWRETFPNNVRKILPRIAFNQELNDKIEEELSQEREDIEDQEFERICSELEKKYRNG